jgi:hypothetical protein
LHRVHFLHFASVRKYDSEENVEPFLRHAER